MTEPFQITVLGSGTAVPMPDRSAPGYLVEIGDQVLLVDPGPGSLHQMAHLDYQLNDVDRILVSHLHPDHNLDLMLFLFASRFEGMKRKRDLEIICPSNFPDMLEDMQSLYGEWVEAEDYSIQLEEVEDVVLDFPGWKLDVYPTIHMDGSVCFSFIRDEGGKIFYSADTAYAQTVANAAQYADVAIVECAMPDDHEVDGHMTPQWVAKLASVADPRRLVLTHCYPPALEADPVAVVKEDYDGPVEIAEDLRTYSIFDEDD